MVFAVILWLQFSNNKSSPNGSFVTEMLGSKEQCFYPPFFVFALFFLLIFFPSLPFWQAVELWLADKAVLPIESSSGGSIHRNYDLLLRHRLHIVGEVQLNINLCLLAMPGVRAEQLKRVLSHSQVKLPFPFYWLSFYFLLWIFCMHLCGVSCFWKEEWYKICCVIGILQTYSICMLTAELSISPERLNGFVSLDGQLWDMLLTASYSNFPLKLGLVQGT